MARIVFENGDLVRYIYSFGDDDHRKFTNNLKLDLRPWPHVFHLSYIDRKMCIDLYGYSVFEYLYEYTTSQITHMISKYSRCYCCQRHNTNKPFLLGNVVTNAPIKVFQNIEHPCNCRCRRLNRIMISHLLERLENLE
jgi:hypothetical protein